MPSTPENDSLNPRVYTAFSVGRRVARGRFVVPKWRDTIVDGLVRLGGEATLPELYRAIQRMRSGLAPNWQATVRRVLGDFSPSSEHFRGEHLFDQVEPGLWRLVSVPISDSKTRRQISYPALSLKQNNHRFYFATIPVDNLFPSCFVARRDEDPISGFQRALNESRADDIARYLASGTGSIPSNIVLSAQENAKFRYDRRSKSIFFNHERAAFLVLDGQHRLWGYQKCKVRHRVPVAIYSGLSRVEEAKLFIDINTTQRGVPAALLLDIKQVAEAESQLEGTLRSMFDRLNTDPESPLVGKLSPAKSIAGKISRVTFNRSLGSALSSGVLADAEREQQYRIIKNYLNAFDAELNDKKLLTRSSFFEAIFQIFDTVIQNALATSKSARREAIQAVISPLTRLNYQGSGGRAISDKRTIASLMQSALRAKTQITDEML